LYSATDFEAGGHEELANCQLLGPDGQAMNLLALLVQAFNKMIDRKMAASPVDGLIVYPEGKYRPNFTLPTLGAVHRCNLVYGFSLQAAM
jgi:hypothetical protein